MSVIASVSLILPITAQSDTPDDTYTKDADMYVQASRKAWEAQSIYRDLERQEQEALVLQDQTLKNIDISQQTLQNALKSSNDATRKLSRFAINASRGNGGIPYTLSALLEGPESMKAIVDSDKMEGLVKDKFTNLYNDAERAKENAQKVAEEVQKKRGEVGTIIAKISDLKVVAHAKQEDSLKELKTAQEAWSKVWLNLPSSDTMSAAELGTKIINDAIIREWEKYKKDQKKAEVKASPESIKIVDEAMKNLNAPYMPDGTSSEGWGCTQFVTSTLGKDPEKASMKKLYQETGKQYAEVEQAQPGDLIFAADPSSGLHQVSINVFGGFVINASSASQKVNVEKIGYDAISLVRVGEATEGNLPAPKKLPDSLDWVCGSIDVEISGEPMSTWELPFDDYELGAKFGEDEDRFGKDGNKGLEFVTKKGENAVHADFSGKVDQVKKSDDYGLSIRIKHSEAFLTTYSFLSAANVKEGDDVDTGSVIGVTGKSGRLSPKKSSTLVRVKMQGEYIDPHEIFFSDRQGKFKNGLIPESELCRISVGGLLRCDAARAFEVLNAAYEKDLGKDMLVTDSYRNLQGQIVCRKNKGSLCAVPGTSNHGWGLAIDFGGGINNFGTKEHEWMRANAVRYGWYHPEWAHINGSNPEAWHWEYVATK